MPHVTNTVRALVTIYRSLWYFFHTTSVISCVTGETEGRSADSKYKDKRQ